MNPVTDFFSHLFAAEGVTVNNVQHARISSNRPLRTFSAAFVNVPTPFSLPGSLDKEPGEELLEASLVVLALLEDFGIL